MLSFRYMINRCKFLDELPAYNYNTGGAETFEDESGDLVATNTQKLGSTMIRRRLSEVNEFSNYSRLKDWNSFSHNQVIINAFTQWYHIFISN